MNDKNKNAPELIEMPEHVRQGITEVTTREMGGAAAAPMIEMPEDFRIPTLVEAPAHASDERSGLYGNGVVVVDKGPGIPIKNPGPQAINQAVANGSFPAENVRR